MTQTGQIMSRVNNDVSGVQRVVTETLANLVRDVTTVTMSVGTIVAYLGALYRPIAQLANIYVDLQGALAIFDLLYARPEASEERLVAACRAANIHELIVSLPEGYETVVGEWGSGGSGCRVGRSSACQSRGPS